MTDERLAELEALTSAATAGPWESDGEVIGWLSGDAPGVAVRWWRKDRPGVSSPVCMCEPDVSVGGKVGGTVRPIDDAAFIAAARSAVPELIAEVRRLRAELAGGRADAMRSIEQAARDVLDAAVRAGLVRPCIGDRSSLNLTAGELVGPANALNDFAAEVAAATRERCARAADGFAAHWWADPKDIAAAIRRGG